MRSLPRPVRIRIVTVWLVIAVLGTIIWHAIEAPQAGHFNLIARDSGLAAATVTLSDPSDHDSFAYRYTVGPTQYTGSSYPQATGQPGAASLHVGEQITVRYSRAEPSISCDCEPHASINGSYWWQNAFVGVLIASFYTVIMVLNARRRYGGAASA